MSKDDLDSEPDESDGLESVGNQLSIYERQLRRTLHDLDAKIDSYHFSIQKEGEGITVDLAIKTTIKLKHKATSAR
jgi:hypothetical protein